MKCAHGSLIDERGRLARDSWLPVQGHFARDYSPGTRFRNGKWLTNLIVSTEESQTPWQLTQYQVFDPLTTAGNVVFDSAPPIYALPVNSYITSHANGAEVEAGTVTMSGYAYSGGGRGIVPVLLSTDGGLTWQRTTITEAGPLDGEVLNWVWAFWQTDVPLGPSGSAVNGMIQAVYTDYQHQSKVMAMLYREKEK